MAWHKSIGSFCAAPFLMTIGTGMFFVAMPFMIKKMGGNDAYVGITLALYNVGYLGVLLYGTTFYERYNPKRLVMTGAMGMLVAIAGVWAINYFHGYIQKPLPVLVFLSIMIGVFTGVYWPPLLGWISKGFEGKDLSKRFGLFNVSWSLANSIGPYIGGRLTVISSTLSLGCGIIAAMLSFLPVIFLRKSQDIKSGETHANAAEEASIPADMNYWIWVSRIGIFAIFACAGLTRSQLGMLLKFQLGYSEADYGLAIASLCFFSFVGFWLAGRYSQWHYVWWMNPVASIAGLGSMQLILGCKSLWGIVAATGTLGFAQAFLYSSHLFYNVSGGKKRSTSAAVHELILTGGAIFGAVASGVLSDSYGRYAPYWLGAGLVMTALVFQLLLGRYIMPIARRFGDRGTQKEKILASESAEIGQD